MRTARLVLTPISPSDMDELRAHWSHPEVKAYLFDGVPPAEEELAAVIQQSQRSFEAHGYGIWTLRISEDGPLLGIAGIRPHEELDEVEIVYSIDPSAWGHGYATEAAQAILETVGRQVIAEVDEGNKASIAVITRLGMRPYETVQGVLGPMIRFKRDSR